MDKDNRIQPIPIVYDQASISLPLDENAFRDFIVSLLGQPESIEGYVEGAFEIDVGGFEHLNNLIDDRIAKQNQSSLLEFRAKLFLNDGSSLSFNGVQSLLNYREFRPLICEGFVFTWSYLVKFNNKQSSEKQEISIFSVKEDTFTNQKPKKHKLKLSNFDIDLSGKMPRIDYSVRCTNKEWGIEITELVRRCLSMFIKTSSSSGVNIRRWFIENFKLIELSSIPLSFFFMMAMLWKSLDIGLQKCQSLLTQVDHFVKDGIRLDEKVNFLLKLVSNCEQRTSISFISFILPLLGMLAGVYFLPILTYKLIQLPSYRFLLFTEESRKKRDGYFRKMNDRKAFWMITVFIGLIIGILGNYAFTLLTNIFR